MSPDPVVTFEKTIATRPLHWEAQPKLKCHRAADLSFPTGFKETDTLTDQQV